MRLLLLLNAWISIALIIMIVIVIADNIRQWFVLLKTKEPVGLYYATNS